jgi:transcriptional pleiotropic regulator of transition state genes
MSSAGVPRTIDRLGRVVVPVEFRRALGLADGDLVEISLEADRVVIAKSPRTCVFCGATIGLVEHRSRSVCERCLAELQDVAPSAKPNRSVV